MTVAVAPTLPVLDLEAFRHAPSSASARRFVNELRDACAGPGFFYLTGHGVPESQRREILDVTRAFFSRPIGEKLAIENVRSPHFRGYTRIGEEHTDGRPDRREQLDFGPELPARAAAVGEPAYRRLEGPNLWPDQPAGLRTAVSSFMDTMRDVALAVVRALAVSLGRPADHFDDTFARDAWPHLKLIHYPARTDGRGRDTGAQGVGAHKDYGFLALLLQDDTGGLEVAAESGAFVAAPAMPGTFVCNIGEMFEVATDGAYRATVHRVASPPAGHDRVSVPYFFAPRLDAVIAPVPLPAALRTATPRTAAPVERHNPIYAEFGENALKGWLRSHPEVARRYWADVLERGR